MESFLKKVSGSINPRMVYFYVGAMIISLAELSLLLLLLPGLFLGFREKFDRFGIRQVEVNSYAESLKVLQSLNGPEVDEQLRKVLYALPDEKKTSGVVSGMTALASSSGVIVTSLEFSPGIVEASAAGQVDEVRQEIVVDEAKNIKAIPASLSIVTNTDGLVSFLHNLSEASQLIGVTSVGYTSDSLDQVKATVAILIYYQPRDINKFSWVGLKPLSESEASYVRALPGEDLFVLR